MRIVHESEFDHAEGLHPHLITNVLTSAAAPSTSALDDTEDEQGCQWDIVYQLPPSLFVDRYQLQDTLGSKYAIVVHGFQNLELPLEHVPPKDTFVILRPLVATTNATIDLPLHKRYQQPDGSLHHRAIHLPLPQVFSICPDHHTLRLPPIHASLSLLPAPDTAQPSTMKLAVPVGDLNDQFAVQWGTTLTIAFVSLWIFWSVLQAIRKQKRIDAKGKRRKSE
ncbi:hypothetical protein DM01DRAFT_1339833 [Hesseltinella vesiculosa]|uniref:Protein PBN1 n=1 Tax=Hesseltinella vesiculosa TaxID=101127 RepID=A0A1X2G5W6_9FUNG|nr:hypothetical protein DM01DRAFT_1339833 [Hesseltinella vesiculosa]